MAKRYMNYNRLLDVLADRKNKKGLSGHVLINGRRQPHNFKCASAYVVQVITVCVCVCVSVCLSVCVCGWVCFCVCVVCVCVRVCVN